MNSHAGIILITISIFVILFPEKGYVARYPETAQKIVKLNNELTVALEKRLGLSWRELSNVSIPIYLGPPAYMDEKVTIQANTVTFLEEKSEVHLRGQWLDVRTGTGHMDVRRFEMKSPNYSLSKTVTCPFWQTIYQKLKNQRAVTSYLTIHEPIDIGPLDFGVRVELIELLGENGGSFYLTFSVGEVFTDQLGEMYNFMGQIFPDAKNFRCPLVFLELKALHDPLHGGNVLTYQLAQTGFGYRLSHQIEHPYPGPGSKVCAPTRTITRFFKEDEVTPFLNDLEGKEGIFSIPSKDWKGVFLHPTHYRVFVRNGCGKEHTISYSLEAGNHHSPKHQHLIVTIRQTFKSMLKE